VKGKVMKGKHCLGNDVTSTTLLYIEFITNEFKETKLRFNTSAYTVTD
jgi:hypothetical protein